MDYENQVATQNRLQPALPPGGEEGVNQQQLDEEARRLAILGTAVLALMARDREAELKRKLEFYKNFSSTGFLLSAVSLVCASLLLVRLNNSDEAELCQVKELKLAMLWYIPLASFMVFFGIAVTARLQQIGYDHWKLGNGLWAEHSCFHQIEALLPLVGLAKLGFFFFALVTLANENDDCFEGDETKGEFKPLYVAVLTVGCLDVWALMLMCGCAILCCPCFVCFASKVKKPSEEAPAQV